MHSTGSRSVGREALWRQKSQTSPKTSLPKFKHQLPSDVWNLDEAKFLPQMLDVGQRVRFGRGPRHLASNTDRRARRMFHLQHFLAYTRTFLIAIGAYGRCLLGNSSKAGMSNPHYPRKSTTRAVFKRMHTNCRCFHALLFF
jgi:hypothetical protein